MGKTMGYLRLIGSRAFKDFAWIRDFTIGFVMSPITLILSIRFGLGAADDWKYHKWFLACAVLAPYLVVIGVHVSWRLFKALTETHHELTDRLRKQVSITELLEDDPTLEVRFVKDHRGYLEVTNRGKVDVFWVRVFPVTTADRILYFDHIEYALKPKERTTFSPYVGTQWGIDDNRDRDFIRALSDNYVKENSSSPAVREATCNAKMEYEDVTGTRFELSFEIIYRTVEEKSVECRNFLYRRIPVGITLL